MQTVKQLVEDVKDDGWYIEYISNPPLEVQLAAVKNNWTAIGFIDNPALPVRRYVIRKSDLGYGMINNPTEFDLAYHQMLWEL